MKYQIKLFIIIILFFTCQKGSAQTAKIGNDGNFVVAYAKSGFLRIQSTHDNSHFEIKSKSYDFGFIADGKFLRYQLNDTLHLMELTNKKEQVFTNIQSFLGEIKFNGNDWIAYQVNGSKHKVVFKDILSGESISYNQVDKCTIREKSKGALIETSALTNGKSRTALKWVDLQEKQIKEFWNSDDTNGKPANFIFDEDGKFLAFSIARPRQGYELWKYTPKTDSASLILDNSSSKIPEGMQIDSLPLLCFNKTGDRIFFMLKEKEIPKIRLKPGLTDVDIWSYTDPVIMSYQKKFSCAKRNFVASFDFKKRQVLQLENQNEILAGSQPYRQDGAKQLGGNFKSVGPNRTNLKSISGGFGNNEYVIVLQWNGNIFTDFDYSGLDYMTGEYYWSDANKISIFLERLNDGSRIKIKDKMKRVWQDEPLVNFSPNGKYLVYYDEEKQAYHSYDILHKVDRNISNRVSASLVWGNDERFNKKLPKGIFGWIGSTEDILLIDHDSDIWKVDLAGTRRPMNLTTGYFRKNHLDLICGQFRDNYKSNQKIILHARCFDNYKDRLLELNLERPGISTGFISDGKLELQYSDNPKVYLVKKESQKQSPYFLVGETLQTLRETDFINQGLINESKTNTEFLSWKAFDGTIGCGLLTTPTNFDPNKKYPVIINYYEENSLINHYLHSSVYAISLNGMGPDGRTNKDYITFIPDISFRNPKLNGLEEAFNYVVSGAKYISKLPYIDSKKIGIHGFSFGGMETNYIVTHTNLFAAAFSGDGQSDYMSNFGTEDNDNQGYSRTDRSGQARLGDHTIDDPKILIKNSPVYHAKAVTTPILLSTGGNDYRVPTAQGVEFFKVLRRLGKRAWLLYYPGVGHTLPEDGKKRMMQFFDHYLLGKPAPIWMTRGIPAKLKGTTDGMAYDTTMKTPGPGLLMDDDARHEPFTPLKKKSKHIKK